MSRNRVANCKNPFQGDRTKTLCVCSAGLLRSPTLAYMLQQEPWKRNTRAVGSSRSFALVPIDDVLMEWADEIIFVNQENFDEVESMMPEEFEEHKHKMLVMDIPDNFEAFDPTLMGIIKRQLIRLFGDIYEHDARLVDDQR